MRERIRKLLAISLSASLMFSGTVYAGELPLEGALDEVTYVSESDAGTLQGAADSLEAEESGVEAIRGEAQEDEGRADEALGTESDAARSDEDGEDETWADAWETRLESAGSGESQSDADEIVVGGTYQDELVIDVKDHHWYKFTAPSNGYLELGFTHGTTRGSGWGCSIHDKEHEDVILYYNFVGTETNDKSPKIGLKEGEEIYIDIYINYWANPAEGIYNMSVDFTPNDYFEREYNNTYQTANEIVINTNYEGFIGNTITEKGLDDLDFYKLTLDHRARVLVNFIDGFGHMAFSQMKDGSLQELFGNDFNESTKKSSSRFLDAGTYYLKFGQRDFQQEATEYTFSVEEVPSEIRLDKDALRMSVGDKKTLSAQVLPATAMDKSVTWESSNEYAAAVDQQGNVTALNNGNAQIKVYSNADPNVFAICNVTVSPKYSLTVSEEFIVDRGTDSSDFEEKVKETVTVYDGDDVTALPEEATLEVLKLDGTSFSYDDFQKGGREIPFAVWFNYSTDYDEYKVSSNEAKVTVRKPEYALSVSPHK